MFKPVRSTFPFGGSAAAQPGSCRPGLLPVRELSSLKPLFLRVATHNEPSEGKVSAFFSPLMHLSLPTPYPVIIR